MQNLILLYLAVYIFDAVSLWRLFKLAGVDYWKAFIPVYNRMTELKIMKRPTWWVIILFVPVVNVIFHFAQHADFLRCYGKRKTIDAILVFLTLGLYVTYVNYDKNTEWVGVEDRKETFLASIIFAIIFATSVHLFVAQPFIIPTSSMENTLRRGDFLIVNKVAYGSRIPITPIALPFLQNKVPMTGNEPQEQVDSYVDAFRIPYLRFPGYEKIKNNSLVVFNYPDDSLHTAIDRKDPYVKRCVGIPGDEIKIVDGNLFINGKPEELPADAEKQYGYYVETDGTQLTQKMMEEQINFISRMDKTNRAEYLVKNASPDIINLKPVIEDNTVIIDSVQKYNEDYKLFSLMNLETILKYKDSIPPLSKAEISLSRVVPIYKFDGLDQQMISKLKSLSFITKITRMDQPAGLQDVNYVVEDRRLTNKIDTSRSIFPITKIWNTDQYGPLYIPKKGDIITLKSENLEQYKNIVNKYEASNVKIKNNKIIADGKEVPTYDYIIQQDYYFMMGDNRDQSLDSRFFGYVPFDHVIGKPSFWWMSWQGGFENGSKKVRFDRMFKIPNNGTPMDEKFNWGWIIIPLIILFFVWDNKRRKKKEKNNQN